jgi:hypothetical protein
MFAFEDKNMFFDFQFPELSFNPKEAKIFVSRKYPGH